MLSTPTWIRPGVKALIVRDGKILVIKERVSREGKLIDIYDFPGGGMEPGEMMEETLRREVREEVCLEVAPERVVGAWEFDILAQDTDEKAGVKIVCIGFQCHLVGPPIIDVTKNPAAEDIFAAEWLTPAAVMALPSMAENPQMVAAVANLII
jgi:8-oxo-dGTP pyrophosphatase MutT (NUDIX family)